MNFYEKSINSFLSSVGSNMSAVYLPALFVSLIQLLEDYYKFDLINDPIHIDASGTKIQISYQISAAYFLSYLYRIRTRVPGIKMAPTRGMTHDERLVSRLPEISAITSPSEILYLPGYDRESLKIIKDMKDSQNVYPVFEKRCPILQCKDYFIEMGVVAVDTLLSNSILYSRMGDLICYQYLNNLSVNAGFNSRIEDYFMRGVSRINFGNTAKNHVLEYQEERCFYCNSRLNKSIAIVKPCADHFIPWAFVKSSLVENLVYACHGCNNNKLDRLPAVTLFNRLLKRNAPGSDFWQSYPEALPNLDLRIDRWVKNYYQASEQLGTNWMPTH